MLQDIISVDNGDFAPDGDNTPRSSCSYLVWIQGSMWYFRTVHGDWCVFRTDDRNSRESTVPVSLNMTTSAPAPHIFVEHFRDPAYSPYAPQISRASLLVPMHSLVQQQL